MTLLVSLSAVSCKPDKNAGPAATKDEPARALTTTPATEPAGIDDRAPASAKAVLHAYYQEKRAGWLNTMSPKDLISALPWAQRVIVPKDRLIEMMDLHFEPGSHDRQHVLDTPLSDLIVWAVRSRDLTLDDFSLFATWVITQWAEADDRGLYSPAFEYPANAIVRDGSAVGMPTGFTMSSLHRRRDPAEPPLAIVQLGPKGAALVPLLLRAARVERYRFEAITILALMAPRVEEAARALIELQCSASNPTLETTAIATHLGDKGVAVLAALLKDPDLKIRRRALSALKEMGAGAHGCQPAVLTLLRDPESDIVWDALGVLQANPPSPQETLSHIADLVYASRLEISSFSNGQETTPLSIVAGLLSKAGAEVAPQVVALLEHAEPELRRAAAAVLRRLVSDEAAAQAFVRLLDHADAEIQQLGLGELEGMGDRAKAAIPALRKKAADARDPHRDDAARVLKQIEGARPASRPGTAE